MNFLHQTDFFHNALIDWIYFLAALILLFLVTKILARSLIKGIEYLTHKTKNELDDAILKLISTPVQLVIRVLGIYLALMLLILPETFKGLVHNLLDSLLLFALFWILHRSVDLFSRYLFNENSKLSTKVNTEIINFTSKTLKVVLIFLAGMSILQEWGVNVSAFVASLGLGGLAFALAAKDTASNLFGSLVILSDKPFNVGDWIQTPQVEGTIEEIGIRSTKVRTFAQALVTVPNAVLANAAVINWSRMGKRRVKTTLTLTYDTTAEQMQNILHDLKSYLQSHDQIDQDTIFVNFSGFGASSLDIFCYFFTKTTNWGEFMHVREKVLLEFMNIITQKNHAKFAFPSHSLYVEKGTLE